MPQTTAVRLLRFNKLYIAVETDLVTYNDLTRFGYRVPGQAKLFAADLSGNSKACFGLIVRIYNDAAKINMQYDWFGYAFNGQVTV
jgi:hypothetical protein